MNGINLLGSELLSSGYTYEGFSKDRKKFEDATIYVDIDFRIRPAKVLIFDGFDHDYLTFKAFSNTETKLKCDKRYFPEFVVDEISRREIPYIINVGKMNILIKANMLQQLARRLGLSRRTIKNISKDSATEIAAAFNRRHARVVLRKQDGLLLFANIYTQNIVHKSMVGAIGKLIEDTGYQLSSWEMYQQYTEVILTGRLLYDNIYPVIKAVYSDVLSFSEDVRFGVKGLGKYVICTDRITDAADAVEVVLETERIFRDNRRKSISYYDCFNDQYKKYAGQQRMKVINESGVKNHQASDACVGTLLYTVNNQIGEIPFNTENSLFEIGKELKKQLIKED